MNLPVQKRLIFNKNNDNFSNTLNNDPKYFCQLDLNIKETGNKGSELEFYDISYTWSYNEWSDNSTDNPGHRCHPFYQDQHFLEDQNDGEIISKNKLTTRMVEFLLMDFDEMVPYIGHTSPEDYKRNIMKCIIECNYVRPIIF